MSNVGIQVSLGEVAASLVLVAIAIAVIRSAIQLTAINGKTSASVSSSKIAWIT